MADVIGEAVVRIRADDTAFGADLEKKVSSATRRAAAAPASKVNLPAADTRRFSSSITTATTKTFKDLEKQAASSLGKLGPLGQAAGNLAGSGISTGLVAGTAVAIGAVTAITNTFVKLADETRRFKQLTGASAETSSHFIAVLDDFKISADTGANAIFLLGKNIEAGGKGLAQFGINVARLKDGSVDLVGTTLNVADVFARTKDQATRNAIAFAAFGRQGRDLIPILEQGRDGLEEFFAANKGQILSEDELRKAREFQLAVDDLSDTWKEFVIAVGPTIVSILSGIADAASAVIDTVKDIGGVLDKIPDPIKKIAGYLVPFVGQINLAKDAFAATSTVIGSDFAAEIIKANPQLLEMAEAQDAVNKSVAKAVDPMRMFVDETGRLVDVYKDGATSIDVFNSRLDHTIFASLDAEDATAKYKDAQERLRDALKDSKGSVDDHSKASRDAAGAFRDVVRAAESQIDALIRDGQITADDVSKKDALQKKLRDLQRQFPELAPEIQKHIDKLNAVPTFRQTNIKVVVDDQDLTGLSSRLQKFERESAKNSIDVSVNAKVTADVFRANTLQVTNFRIPGRQHGGDVESGKPYFVGERGIELRTFSRSGAIISYAQILDALRAALSGDTGFANFRPGFVRFEDGSYGPLAGKIDMGGRSGRAPSIVSQQEAFARSIAQMIDRIMRNFDKQLSSREPRSITINVYSSGNAMETAEAIDRRLGEGAAR